MLYQNFNQYIKTKFFPPGKRGETILFSVDETIITEFLNKENIIGKTFQRTISYELKDWSITRANENYFGLCAIQIFMVSQMQDDVEYSAREYNPRLADYLRIDTNTLQKLYADNQDTIWEKLKQYAGENDYRINIPGQSSGRGRYIQYPFSQALLNKEDLRKTPILFQRIGVTQSEYIPFEDFALLIKAAERESGMPGRYNKIKNKLLNDRGDTMSLYQQIYDYFINEWDGTYPSGQQQNTSGKGKKKAQKNSHLYLSKNLHYIMVLNDEFEPINKIPLSSKGLFSQIENHHPIYSDELLIFQTDEETGEAEYVRHFEPGYKYTIICKQCSEAHRRIHTFRNITKHPNNYYEIYQTGTLNQKTGHPFWDYFFTRHPRNYKIEGGLKLAYKAWMHGCGPQINFREKTTAWINGSKIESQQINCSNFEPGTYKLVHESSIEKFEIRQPQYILQSTCNGWIINEEQKTWHPATENCQMIGLINNFPIEDIPGEKENIRTWINYLTRETNNTNTKIQVLKAIKRAKYGI